MLFLTKRALCVVLIGCACGQVYTQNTQQEKTVNLDPIVVTGTGTHRRMSNSPMPVKVITANDLQNANITSLEDALVKLTPNITTMTNGMGTFLNMNGLKEEYVVILENGKRLASDDTYTRINVANIKRIEILNGAASALYGSDAIGGVINIITDESKNKVNVSNQTHYTSKGRLSESISVDAHAGKFGTHTTYQHREADNWQVNNLDEEGNLTGRPMSTGFRSDNISQRFTWDFNNRFSVYLRGTLYDYSTRRPQAATYYKKSSKKDEDGNPIYTETRAYTYDIAHTTYTYGAGAKYKISPKSYLEADFFADNYTSDYAYFVSSGDFKPGDKHNIKETHYYNAQIKGIFRLGMHKLSAGTEYINEHYSSESDNIAFENMYTLALFAQDELNFGRHWQAVIGLRYLYNENFKSHAVPSAALMYRLGGLNLRAAYSAGFRAPTLYQIYGTDESKTSDRATIGNRDLKPEKSHFWSLNAEYTTSRFSISVNGFWNHVKDMIDYRVLSEEEILANGAGELHERFGTIRQRDNVNKADIKGVSVNAQVYVGAGLTLGGSYIHTDSKAKTIKQDSQTGAVTWLETPVDKSVKNAANLYARWNHAWDNYQLNVNLNGHIQGERYSSTYGYAPKYQQWDLNTRHIFTLDGFTLEPGIGVENLFNKRDTRPWNSNFSTINPGRAVMLSFAVRFTK